MAAPARRVADYESADRVACVGVACVGVSSPTEIQALAAARALAPGLQAATFETIIGLLAITGLRPGEALGLDRADVDLTDGLLHVRAAKQSEHREVPLHDTTTIALRDHCRLRDRHLPACSSSAFFVSPQGSRLAADAVNATFAKLVRQVGLGGKGERVRPRAHDLRHSFAVRTLIGWYQAGENTDAKLPLLSTYPTRRPRLELLVSANLTRAARARARPARARRWRAVMSLLAPTLQAFFTDRLITQRDVNPSTVAAYRDTFRLLLAFVEQQTGKQLDLADLDAPLIGAFLTHLERGRHNTPRTRNARLAAIHSFNRYAALRHPEHLATIARIMAIPTKRHQRNDLTYLTKPEIEALVQAPDQATWLGGRDHTLLLTMITTGVRVSEVIAINLSDVTLTPGAQHLRVHRKAGRTAPPAESRDHHRTPCMAARTRRGAPRAAVPHPARTSAAPTNRRAARDQTRPRRGSPLPVPRDPTRQPPHPPTHQRDAPPSRTHRHRHHGALARPTREHQDHLHLPTRRQPAQTTSDRPHCHDRHPRYQPPDTLIAFLQAL
jgi:integrase